MLVLRAFIACLAEAWTPALNQANEPVLTATVQVTLPETSACGKTTAACNTWAASASEVT